MVCRHVNNMTITNVTRISSLWDLKPGDHIQVPGQSSKLYHHHLMVVKILSDTELLVIHSNVDRGVVEETKVKDAREVEVLIYPCIYSGREAIERARQYIGRVNEYNLAHNNCEHFIRWTKTGVRASTQINAIVGLSVGAGLGAMLGGMASSFVGMVAGLAVGGAVGAVIGFCLT